MENINEDTLSYNNNVRCIKHTRSQTYSRMNQSSNNRKNHYRSQNLCLKYQCQDFDEQLLNDSQDQYFLKTEIYKQKLNIKNIEQQRISQEQKIKQLTKQLTEMQIQRDQSEDEMTKEQVNALIFIKKHLIKSNTYFSAQLTKKLDQIKSRIHFYNQNQQNQTELNKLTYENVKI